MVQQVASVKTESAATSLPFNFAQSAFSGSSDSFTAFSSELIRQTKQISREPIKDSANNPVVRDFNSVNNPNRERIDNQRSASDLQQGYYKKQAELKERQQQSQTNDNLDRDVLENVNEPDHKQLDTTSRKSSRSAMSDRSDDAQIVEDNKLKPGNTEQSKANALAADTQPSKSEHSETDSKITSKTESSLNRTQPETEAVNTRPDNDILIASQAGEPAIEVLELVGKDEDVNKLPSQLSLKEGKKEEFDYVSFVTQISQINSKQEQTTDTASPQIIEDAKVSESPKGQNTLNTHEDTIKIDVDEKFPSVFVNKQDFQTILNLQEVNIDLNNQLTSDELQELKNVISDMINQMHEQSADMEQKAVKLDEELMLNVLMAQKATKQYSVDDVATNMPAENKVIEIGSASVAQLDSQTSNLLDELKLDANVTPETVIPTIETNKSLDDANSSDNKKTNPSIAALDKKPNSHLIALAELNESQTQKAVENITSRLQIFVSELNEPAKGNEFIAALQSNVKEFKQHLAQGAESTKDLKSLINDALTASGIEISSNKQVKIDGVVNQFNAVLNLANNVNYSANLQQAQVLGITDLQFAKELNQQQIDGTKLANASNQAALHANADKAVNIFKQEGQAQLAEKVRWMVNSRNQSAEVRLDPPDLGGINIRVNMNGDSAQVSFNVQSNAAKEALDQALPRLRDMLQEQGIELGQSNVQQDNQQKHGQSEQENSSSGSLFASDNRSTSGVEIESQPEAIEQRVVNGVLGGVDYYA